jgi:hypothetical protein
VQRKNSRIYNWRGLKRLYSALKPGGRVAFWSAVEEPEFVGHLKRAGFGVEVVPAKAHERARQWPHRIYVAQRAAAAGRT